MKYIIFVILLLSLFFRFLTTRPVYNDNDNIRITSKVYGEPIVYDEKQYLKLQGLKVYLPKYPEIIYGDRVVMEGKVNGDSLENPRLIEIDNRHKGLLLVLRQRLISFYKSSLPEPYGSLVAGIVIGSKNMPDSFWQKLKATGTAHVVVASGTNVTMTAGFLIGVLTIFLKRRHAIWFTLLGIFAYVVISGFDAPIVRAGIMGAILLLGQQKGKVVNTWRILVYSGLIMLIIKPEWITDLGFILSFTAATSLVVFQKIIDLRLKIIPAIFREGLSTSIAAQIGVAPIIFATFGQFNVLSPIINMFILWTVPYIMVLGAVGGLIGLVVPLVGRLILFILFPLTWYFTKVISIF